MPERVTLEELLDEYLYCRTIGHAWDDNPSGEMVNSDLYRAAYAVENVRCTRCTMERIRYLAADMTPISKPYYRKPPRYDTIVGMGKRPNVRSELLRRNLLIHVTERVEKRRRRGNSR